MRTQPSTNEQARQLEEEVEQELKKNFAKFCQSLDLIGYEPDAQLKDVNLAKEKDLSKFCNAMLVILADVIASKNKLITPQIKNQVGVMQERAETFLDVLDTNIKIKNKHVSSFDELGSYLDRMEKRVKAAGSDEKYRDFLSLQMLESKAMLLSNSSKKEVAAGPDLKKFDSLVNEMFKALPSTWQRVDPAINQEAEMLQRELVKVLATGKKKDTAKREAFIGLLDAIQESRKQVAEGKSSVQNAFAPESALMKAIGVAIEASKDKTSRVGRFFRGESKVAKALTEFRETLPRKLESVPTKTFSDHGGDKSR